jgi:hypothetical protein
MSIRDVILQNSENNKSFERTLNITRCVTAAVDYADSAASYRRPGWTWVKEWGQARLFEVFNPTGRNNVDMPVLVYNLPKPPFMKAIYAIDWETLAGNLVSDIGSGGGVGGTPTGGHYLTHEWYDGYMGIDALRVYMRSIASMQAFVSTGLTLQILPGTYLYHEAEASYAGGFYDLTSKLPAAGKCVRVMVYYDPSDYTVKSVSSAELPLGGNPTFTIPPKYTLPIAWVLLNFGDAGTTLAESRINDARALWYIRGLHAADHKEGGDDELDITELDGITITAPVADNEVLAYDTGSGDWINQTAAEASLSAVGHQHVEADITDLDHDAVKIQGADVPAPLAGDDQKALVYDAASGDFIYATAGGSGGGGGDLYWFIDGVLAVQAGVGQTLVAPYAMTISNVIIYVKENGSANTTTIDVNINGASIFAGAKPTIAHNDPDNIAEQVPDTTAIAADDLITIDIDAIATGAAGLTVCVVTAATIIGGAPTDATYVTEDASAGLSAESVLGTTVITTAAHAARQASAKAGRIYLPSDGYHLWRDTGAIWAPWGPVFPCTEPPSAGWTWDNQDTATVAAEKGGLHLYTTANAGVEVYGYYRTAPAVPYVITALVIPRAVAGNYVGFGLGWRDAATGKIAVPLFTYIAGWYIDFQKWTTSTSYSATYGNQGVGYLPNYIFLRIADNNTNRVTSISFDGQNFIVLHTVGRTDFLTADQYGLFLRSQGGLPVGMTVISLKEE